MAQSPWGTLKGAEYEVDPKALRGEKPSSNGGGLFRKKADDVVDDIAKTGNAPTSKDLDLTDAKARKHILEGDVTGGGHRPGTGIPGKSEFPSGWSDERILDSISDIATDPKVTWSRPDKRGYITGTKTIDGIDIKVVFDTKNQRIVTGYPTNVPRNP